MDVDMHVLYLRINLKLSSSLFFLHALNFLCWLAIFYEHHLRVIIMLQWTKCCLYGPIYSRDILLKIWIYRFWLFSYEYIRKRLLNLSTAISTQENWFSILTQPPECLWPWVTDFPFLSLNSSSVKRNGYRSLIIFQISFLYHIPW